MHVENKLLNLKLYAGQHGSVCDSNCVFVKSSINSEHNYLMVPAIHVYICIGSSAFAQLTIQQGWITSGAQL